MKVIGLIMWTPVRSAHLYARFFFFDLYDVCILIELWNLIVMLNIFKRGIYIVYVYYTSYKYIYLYNYTI